MATEFPDLGDHCTVGACRQHDFLPMKCDACTNIYCSAHIMYASHACVNGHLRDAQVPVCPLCQRPIPVPKGTPADVVVGRHIDSDCKSDVAKKRIYKNACNMKGCKKRELIEVLCSTCRLNFCLRHRFVTDHDCQGKSGAAAAAASARLASSKSCGEQSRQHQQGNSTMTDDEALARAMQISLNSGGNSNELSDEQLAERLQQQEYNMQQDGQRPAATTRNNRSCRIS